MRVMRMMTRHKGSVPPGGGILSRRALLLTSAALLLSVRPAGAAGSLAEEKIKAFAGGKLPVPGRVRLIIADAVEDGSTVPVAVKVEGALSPDSHVEAVTILAGDNPEPEVATFHFTAQSGMAAVATRIRLARSQPVLAIARMNDGRVFMDSKNVSVTIGGCS